MSPFFKGDFFLSAIETLFDKEGQRRFFTKHCIEKVSINA